MVDLLYDHSGNRKYITERERRLFLRTARKTAPRPVYTFCLVLALTGARLSEVLALTPRHIDVHGRLIVYRTLKKRKKVEYRAVPVPAWLIREVDTVHGITAARQDVTRADVRIWPWCRTTGWTRVKEVMSTAGITGIQGTAKGCRHGFAVDALVKKVPLVIVQEWLGHAKLETTAIYSKAVATEARTIANRMWGLGLRFGLRW